MIILMQKRFSNNHSSYSPSFTEPHEYQQQQKSKWIKILQSSIFNSTISINIRISAESYRYLLYTSPV